ncbi:MAG: hypothetical protein JSS82_12425 [Bacteroidetes bacterium]|nr:hypothetical protein [Bacteroidota bacterium]
MSVTISISTVDVHLLPARKRSSRKAHGETIIFYGSHEFDVNDGVAHRLRIPCESMHTVFDQPTVIELPLRSDIVRTLDEKSTYTLDPNAILGFRVLTRHFKSDDIGGYNEEVRHALGYGFFNLSDLQSGEAVCDIVDFPANGEIYYAEKEGGEVKELSDSFLLRNHYPFSFRGYIKVSGVEVTCSSGVRIVRKDSTETSPYGLFPYARSTPDGKLAYKKLMKLFQLFIDDVMLAAHQGKRGLLGYTPRSSLYTPFVASYDMETGIRVPAPLALAAMIHIDKPDERLFHHLMMGQLKLYSISVKDFCECLENILARYEAWKTDKTVKGNISHREEKCIKLLLLMLASISNSIAYTSDVADVAGKEIITEQLVIRLWEDRAGDCEDVAALIRRMQLSLVMHKHTWDTVFVQLVAKVADLYSFMINCTKSGECHILVTAELRQQLLVRLIHGAETLMRKQPKLASQKKSIIDGLTETVFWPSWVYYGDAEPTLPKNMVSIPTFLPGTFYVEGTRVSPVSHRHHTRVACSDAERHKESVVRRTNATVLACSKFPEFSDIINSFEPSVVERMDGSSAFYEGFICMYLLPPPLIYVIQRGAHAIPDALQMLSSKKYYSCAMYHSPSAPGTYGVCHEDVANARNNYILLPFAEITEELLVGFMSVYYTEPPVLSPKLPMHLRSVALENLGEPEKLPQLNRTALLQRLSHAMERVRGEKKKYIKIRCYPHDCLLGSDHLEQLVHSLRDSVVAIDGRRIQLVAAGCETKPPPRSVTVKTDKFLKDNDMLHLDAAEYVFYTPNIKDDTIRHELDRRFRCRALNYNVLDLYVDSP